MKSTQHSWHPRMALVILVVSCALALSAYSDPLMEAPPSGTIEAPQPLAPKSFTAIQAVTLRCVGANGVFDFAEEGSDDLLFAIPIGLDGRGYKLAVQPPMDMRCRFIVPREGQLNEVEL